MVEVFRGSDVESAPIVNAIVLHCPLDDGGAEFDGLLRCLPVGQGRFGWRQSRARESRNVAVVTVPVPGSKDTADGRYEGIVNIWGPRRSLWLPRLG